MSFSYHPTPVPLARPGSVVSVHRYDPDSASGAKYQALPNVRCLSVEMSEGAEPGAARFRYAFDDVTGRPGAPTRLEHVYGLGAVGRYVVRPDDRLVVVRHAGGGGTELLFDGFALIPQADLSSDGEAVTFSALATPVREWDYPLPGAFMRDADDPSQVSDVATDRPVRFNPDGRPNMTPAGADASTGAEFGAYEYPTFCGPIAAPTGKAGGVDVWALNGSELRHWTLGDAVKYLLARGRRDADDDPTDWVRIEEWDDIGPGLQAIAPVASGGPVDLDDSSTWELKDIVVQDFDAKDEAWPEAVQRLIEPHGFSMCFDLRDEGGEPRWYLRVYRKDIPSPLKRLYLQAAGAALDPGRTNVGGVHLARDSRRIANRIEVDTAPVRVEASFVLAPGFPVAAGDVAAAADFARAAIGEDPGSDDYQKYRTFVFDEIGEGHWDLAGGAMAYDAGDLAPIFRPADGDDEEAPRAFVRRRRPGEGRLVDVDGRGAPREKELWISADYAGAAPGLWDGSGTWQMVQSGEWSLLKDRLGVRLAMADVKQFAIGKSTDASMPFPGGKVDVVQSLAAPTDASPEFHLRLTCTVEADRGIGVVAEKRSASPTRFAITRRVDARDRFERDVISRYSATLAAEGSDAADEAARDDRAKAQDHADATRRAHERASFAGTVTIPRVTLAYRLGDKIEGIEGRDVGLKTNAGGEQGETDTYPVVVGLAWSCEEPQGTQLTLDDRRADPPRRRTK